MTFIEFLGALQGTWPVEQLRGANHLVIEITEVVHVLGLVGLLTAVLLLSLRLLGVVLPALPSATVARAASPLLWGGLAAAMVTGTLLFLSGPVRYYANAAFGPKMVLLALALVTQAVLYRRVVRAPEPGPAVARSGAALLLALWFGVGLCGRAIGYI
jgi:hypothetical protein